MIKIPAIDILKDKSDEITWVNTRVFIDLDNVSWNELGTFDLFGKDTYISVYADKDHIKMFDNNRFKEAVKNTSAHVQTINVPTGKNATDFFIVCDMASALADLHTTRAYIISNDKGYDSVIKRMQNMYPYGVQAIERFSSTAECMKDYMFFKSKSKLDVKENIYALISGEYRKSAIERVLQILER